MPALQILKDTNDEGFEVVPRENVKHCVGNFVPPEAPILMNSFENTNSHSPACVQRQADGRSFVNPGKRADQHKLHVDQHECASPSDPGTECGRCGPGFGNIVNTIPDVRVGAFENDQQLAGAIKLNLSPP